MHRSAEHACVQIDNVKPESDGHVAEHLQQVG